jgi:hypothetical protein
VTDRPHGAPDLARLLDYKGRSLREAGPLEDGVIILDFRDTYDNEATISTLLSGCGIPFAIERSAGAARGGIRLGVIVPRPELHRAEEILGAAADASLLDRVEGIADLRTRSARPRRGPRK